jgi:hypothetical protein
MYPRGDKHFIAQRDVSPRGFLERGYRFEETPRAAMTRVESVYRKPGASSRGQAASEVHVTDLTRIPEARNPLGDASYWVMTDAPAVH